MLINVIGRHIDITPPLKDHAEQKASKLTNYYDLIQRIEVILNAGKDDASVEVIVHADHKNTFVAHQSGTDAYGCIDGAIHKMERQLSEHKQKFRNRKHSGAE